MKQYKIEEFKMDFDKTTITDYCVDNKLFKTREEANNYRKTKLNYINMCIVEIEKEIEKED